MSTYTTREVLPPPSERTTVWNWMRENLFGTWYNALLSLAVIWFVFVLLRGIASWMVLEARWDVIAANLRLFLVGQYPSMIEGQTDYIWRIWLVVYLLAAVVGLAWAAWSSKENKPTAIFLLAFPLLIVFSPWIVNPIFKILGVFFGAEEVFTFPAFRVQTILLTFGLDVVAIAVWTISHRHAKKLGRAAILAILAYFPIALLIISGFFAEDSGVPFAIIPTRFWGGLLLSLLLSIVGIVFSFPIGVLLALGRQSELPVMRTLSVLYIEIIRGVPLITLLFMGQIMLPLFLPEGITVDRVIRAMVAIVMFAAAYLAENVRGGLQAIPRGQHEAAYAIGLNSFQTMAFIILPQALRTVIPVLVGQFIGLFKDTTLVALVGLLDLLGIARGVISNPKFIGTQNEVFAFISVFYFIFSYGMSYASQRLEESLGVGER